MKHKDNLTFLYFMQLKSNFSFNNPTVICVSLYKLSLIHVAGKKLRRLTNYMESPKDDSGTTQPRKGAGKRTRKILHTEKLT
jgi:hypothetical protein